MTVAVGPAERRTAQELNALGMERYWARDFAAAMDLFALAVARDPSHALAHYNLACAAMRLRREQDCRVFLGTVLHHLARSVELDPARRERMRQDPDLTGLHGLVAWRRIDGKDLTDPTALPEALRGVTFYGPKPGVYRGSELELNADGTVTRWGYAGEDMRWTSTSGSWSVIDGVVRVTIGGTTTSYRLTPQGALREVGGAQQWGPLPDECSA
jgi:hypothetical protein